MMQWSVGILNIYKNILFNKKKQQSGAVEACWAHNPEVRRSKLRSAKFFFSKPELFIYVWLKIICATYFKP